MDIWIPVVLAIVAAVVVPTITGLGVWLRWKREDKLKDLQKIEALQLEIKTAMQDRIKDEMNKRLEAETSSKTIMELATLNKQSLTALLNIQALLKERGP